MTTKYPASGIARELTPEQERGRKQLGILAPSKLPRDSSSAAIQARIEAWCGWFDLEIPKIRPAGRRFPVDPLVAWCIDVDASMDWIIFGDVRAMAQVYHLIQGWVREEREKDSAHG